MTFAQEERAALVETMRSVGPDAPTLCAGWTAKDLLAHLVVRERRPDTAPGIMIPAFAGHTEKVRAAAAAGSWDDMLAQLAAGPPLYSPLKVVDRWANLAEMFVHHEDVLRGAARPDQTWTPREISAELQEALIAPAKSMSRMTLKSCPARVTLRTRDSRDLVTVGTGPEAVVVGNPGELLLFAFGRAPVNVVFDGDEQAVSAVQAAKRGL
ncbi:TIGR03085 family metal-binding protein [Gordonia aquimaris]|uniref:TIGR03085 family metal-binding protein n=1 Tax=Gordonia aquimaris TaxID=2984863 RepID=A0A9X3I562_9ACTN|nr:TIGR03085 family metal-binding protein [Gordonia aquimaris]MCX2965427.1 TIGR03085 family metal-binding protein [Gordonia aquimaris]